MIAEHLPALQVVVPLMAAPVAVILRRPALAWALALTVSWIAFAIALALLARVLETGTVSYAIGSWAAPWGIEYRIDKVGAFMLVTVSAIGATVMPFARRSVAHEVASDRIYLFYCMYLLCLAGLLGIAITGDAFNLFVFLEIASLSSYVLVSLGNDRRALMASFRYLVMGTIGATFYIIGVGLMYMMTGTLNMADLAARLPAVAETRTILAAVAFLTVGISLKLALAPLHLWLPNAYTFAPSVVTAFLAATATKVAVYVLIRIYFTIFGAIDAIETLQVREVLMTLAVVSMVAGSVVAIFQTNVKRMFAYSSIAQIGYMILGISIASVTGLAGGIVHLFNHALIKGTLFLAMGCVVLRLDSVRLGDLAGLGRRMPATAAAVVVGGFGLIGVPLTAGFVSKWYLIQAALEKGWWPLAALVLATSLMAVVYVGRLLEVIYLRPVPVGVIAVREAPPSMLAPVWLLAGASLYFGVTATETMDIARGAAALLLGVAP